MAKLVLKMILSLDSLVAPPDGGTEWMAGHENAAETEAEVSILWDAQAHLMGSRSFNDMQAYWPHTTGPIADAMNAIPKVTFSRTGLAAAGTTTALDQSLAHRDAAGRQAAEPAGVAGWQQPEIFTGELASGLAELKARPGKPILLHGGAGFARATVATGLVDAYHLFTYPVVLGQGMGIFDGLSAPLRLELVEFERFATGSTRALYHPV